jgi:hypothetical protein
MSFAVLGIASMVVCWKWCNWRNWKEYYPTILFFIFGNLVYVLAQRKPLWHFGEISKQYPIFDIYMMLCPYPSTTVLYLSSLVKQALYILFWACIYTAAEIIPNLTGGFAYSNGWNLFYSVLFDIIMFLLLRLHFKSHCWHGPYPLVVPQQ